MKYFALALVLVSAALAPAQAAAQQTPTPAAAPWWSLATDLPGDEMHGRDTGTEACERAAKFVAAHFRRTDSYNFVRIGIPIAGFIFGCNPGTEEERIDRDWYARRCHKPQGDLLTPIDWTAALKFNDFCRALVLAVANAPTRPAWLPTSPYAPKP